MAVNLSPVGGVAAQFFDNNGVPLSGGLIYTYAAGTSTPQATYTSSNGGTAQANPIVLDSSGRVPSGEIWLTDGLQYKFVLQNANAVLIGTYDNIIGINSNFVNFTNAQEIQTATASQTVFTLTTMQYQPGTGSLSVFVDGVNQYGPGAQYAYNETSATVITFVNGLHVGASVKFTTSAINASSYGNSSQISYTPAGTGSIPTNVQAKLRESVSVLDFGADPTGVADSTTAIQAAINEAITQKSTLVFPGGYYRISTALAVTQPINIEGNRAQIYQQTADASVFSFNGGGTTAGFIRNTAVVKDLILGTAAGIGKAIRIYQFMCCTFQDIVIPYAYKGVECIGGILNVFNNVRVSGTMPTSPGFFVSVGVQTANYIGFHFYAGDVSGANANTLIQCYAQGSTRSSYEFAASNNNTLLNCDSEFAVGVLGYHIYADGAINLNVISGDWEGQPNEMYFTNCQSPMVTGAFVNNQVTIAGTTKGAVIKGGVYKIINIGASAVSTSVEDVSLYVGASGILDSGINTHIGRVYNMQTSNAYAGGEWAKTFVPVLKVGGTTETTHVTRNNGYIQQADNFAFLEISITWSSLVNTGAITIDVSSVLPTLTGRFSVLSVEFDSLTMPAGFTMPQAVLQSNGTVNLYLVNQTPASTRQIASTDVGVNAYVYISGVVRTANPV